MLPGRAQVSVEGDTIDSQAAGENRFVAACSADRKQRDDFASFRQGELATHCRRIESLHRRRIPAAHFRGEHKDREGDHHMAVRPDAGRKTGDEVEGALLAFFQPLGRQLYYVSMSSGGKGAQSADLTLMRWTGDANQPFIPVSSVQTR